MDTSTQPDVPQPPKQTAYTQSSNPVSRNPQEQRGQTVQPTELDSDLMHTLSSASTGVHRTADSKPSSEKKLQHLKQEHNQEVDPEGKRGHIDLEYGIEQQPREGDIASAVQGKTENTPRVQPGAHSGPVNSTPGFEQDTAAQMDRKREEHDQILRERKGRG